MRPVEHAQHPLERLGGSAIALGLGPLELHRRVRGVEKEAIDRPREGRRHDPLEQPPLVARSPRIESPSLGPVRIGGEHPRLRGDGWIGGRVDIDLTQTHIHEEQSAVALHVVEGRVAGRVEHDEIEAGELGGRLGRRAVIHRPGLDPAQRPGRSGAGPCGAAGHDRQCDGEQPAAYRPVQMIPIPSRSRTLRFERRLRRRNLLGGGFGRGAEPPSELLNAKRRAPPDASGGRSWP